MKLYSKILIVFYFVTTIVLLSVGAISTFIKEYYYSVKNYILLSIERIYNIKRRLPTI